MPEFTVVRTTREYETIFILRPDANEEERNRVLDRVTSVMEKLEGHLIQRDVWGERKLAYKMKKYDRGTYYYYRYLGYGDLVTELERNFRLLDPVIKFLTVKIEEDVDRDARLAEAEAAAEPEVEAEVAAEADAETEAEAEVDVKTAPSAE